MRRLISLVFLLLSFYRYLPAQVAGHFRSFSQDMGMVAASKHVMQDSYGFLWASTGSGLVKTDGYSYQFYNNRPGDPTALKANDIFCSFDIGNGDLWVGPYNSGLAVLDRVKDEFSSILPSNEANGLKISTIACFAKDSAGNIWIGGSDGLQYVKRKDVENKEYIFHHIASNDSIFSPTRIRSLVVDHEGDIWIAAGNGISRISKDLKTIYQPSTHLSYPNQIGECIIQDENGNLFFAVKNSPLIKYLKTSERFEKDPSILIGANRVSMTFDAQERLWIKDNSTLLYCYDLANNTIKSWDPTRLNEINLYSPYARTLLTSKEGSIWNIGPGNLAFQHLPASNKRIDQLLIKELGSVNSSAVYVDGKYTWIGHLLSGIKRISKTDGTIKEFNQENSPLNTNRIYNFLRLSEKELLICASHGVYVYDYLSEKIRLVFNSGKLMRHAWFDKKETLWISAESNGLFQLNTKTWNANQLFDGKNGNPTVNNVRQIISGEGSWIWLATIFNGLYKYNIATKEILHYSAQATEQKYKIHSDQIESIFLSDENSLYLGTRAGLHIIDLNTHKHKTITSKEGLSNNLIASITPDRQGHLWISTSNGLNKFNMESEQIITYYQSDGFSGNQYYPRADYIDDEGFLYVAGPGGVDRFRSEEIGINAIAPIVQLTSIEVLGKNYDEIKAPELLKKLTLSHEQNFLQLGFSPIHFTSPESNQIAYRLNSHNSDWTIAENYKVALTGLAPGSYKLEVKAANADGVWTKQPKSYQINIGYPWWRSTAFYLLSFLLFGLLGYLTFKRYTKRLKAKQKLQEDHKIRVAELELKSLSSQMNPHFIFNSLNSIKSLISQGKNDAANNYITRYSNLVRRILNNSRSKFVRLQNELEALELYIELESLRLEKAFKYSIVVGENVNADFIEIPPSLLQPFVENAIWHGLMLKESDDKKKLEIIVSREGDFIVLEIIDNGIGVEASKQLRQNKSLGRESLGVSIAQERAELLSELYGHETSIVIEELRDKNHEIVGTKVVIRMFIEE